MSTVHRLHLRVQLLASACDAMGTPRTEHQWRKLCRLIDRLGQARQNFMRAAGHC